LSFFHCHLVMGTCFICETHIFNDSSIYLGGWSWILLTRLSIYI
jgi:hypothetical protein